MWLAIAQQPGLDVTNPITDQTTVLDKFVPQSLQGRASLAALVVVNLLPLAGVIWLDWDVAALVILYWSENLVIGFYTLCKMLLVAPLKGLFPALFFTIHFGGFCAAHGMFIMAMLVDGDMEFMQDDPWPLFLVFVQLLVDVVRQVLDYAPPEWRLMFAGLVLSHGLSFVLNFLLGGERHSARVRDLMGEPYGRIVVLHIAIILGGFAVMALGQPGALLILLVALKLAMDIKLHRRQHRGYEKKMAADQAAAEAQAQQDRPGEQVI
jgi:hypothetical protein